jgi:hypothetical protein
LENQNSGGRKPTLSVEQEEEVVNKLKIMSKWGFGLGKEDVLNVIQDFVTLNKIKKNLTNNHPGRDWFVSFCKKRSLSLKKPELQESSRSRQSNDPFVIYDFFEQLSTVVSSLELESKPECIYDCDESGLEWFDLV